MWKGYILTILLSRLEHLKMELERIYTNDPNRLKGHPSAKLFIAIIDSIDEVLQNPEREEYILGNTLGKNHRDWRRVKKRLPPRHRMFFKFFSNSEEVFFAWLNDENTLRKKGAKTDCYERFASMLKSGQIPSNQKELASQSSDYNEFQSK